MFGHLFAVIIRSVIILSFIHVSISLTWTDHQNIHRNGPWLKWNLQVLDGSLGSAPRTVC